MCTQRIGWLSVVAGGVLALGLSLSSEAWAQKKGPPTTQKVGDPIGSVDVGLGQKPGGARFTAKTDKNGEFEFANLEPGMYEVLSLSGFPVGKMMRCNVTIETGWTVLVGQAEGDAGGGTPPKKGGPVTLSGQGKDTTQEKYSTTKSNIKWITVDVLPDGGGKLKDSVVMEIHAVGSEIMITGPGTGVVGSTGTNPGEGGYAIKEQGIKQVMPTVVAGPMWLRGRVFVSKATTGLDIPATGVGTPVNDVPGVQPASDSRDPAANDVPVEVKPKKREIKIPKLPKIPK